MPIANEINVRATQFDHLSSFSVPPLSFMSGRSIQDGPAGTSASSSASGMYHLDGGNAVAQSWTRCSGIHRGMGTHISRVKSVDLDAWTDEQLESVLHWGNTRANKSVSAPGPRHAMLMADGNIGIGKQSWRPVMFRPKRKARNSGARRTTCAKMELQED